MSEYTFGQFLIHEREIDAQQLRLALELIEHHDPQLAHLAVESGYMSTTQMQTLLKQQQASERPFGVLAVQKGLLTSFELNELRQLQDMKRMPVAQALVQLGYVSDDRINIVQQRFLDNQSKLEGQDRILPSVLQGNPLFACLLDCVQRDASRMARAELVIGPMVVARVEALQAYSATVDFCGPSDFRVGISVDREFAMYMMRHGLGLDLKDPHSELIESVVLELLSQIASNTISSMSTLGHNVACTAPVSGYELLDGFACEILGQQGTAILFIGHELELQMPPMVR